MRSVLTFAAKRRTGVMRGIWGSGVAALLAAASSGAFAADLPVKAPVMAPLPVYYNWTGFYIGGNLGGAWDTASITDDFFGVNLSASRSGFIGGGQIGYNWQFSPQWVFGVEWMFDGTDISSNFGPVTDILGNSFSANEKVDWLTTFTGRFGYAANNWLFYVKGGGGWVHDTATATVAAAGGGVFSASASDTKGGWVLGGGIEYGFTPNWTTKVEYQHVGLGDVTAANGFDTVTFSRHFDMVTVGLNYKF
jgi:outer membrane immunogenic protein